MAAAMAGGKGRKKVSLCNKEEGRVVDACSVHRHVPPCTAGFSRARSRERERERESPKEAALRH